MVWAEKMVKNSYEKMRRGKQKISKNCYICILSCLYESVNPFFGAYFLIGRDIARLFCCCSVTLLCLALWNPRLPSPSPRVCPSSCSLHQWCCPAISSSDALFSSCLQSFSESGSFPMSRFFASGGQSTGVSASVSVLPMNIQDWFPLGWTGLISLQSKGLSRVFSNTTVQKHPTLTSIHDCWKNHSFDKMDL